MGHSDIWIWYGMVRVNYGHLPFMFHQLLLGDTRGQIIEDGVVHFGGT